MRYQAGSAVACVLRPLMCSIKVLYHSFWVLNHFSAVLHNYMAIFLFSCFYLQSNGLHFRHTDNTVQWLRAMESVGLPKVRGLHSHQSVLQTYTDMHSIHELMQHNIMWSFLWKVLLHLRNVVLTSVVSPQSWYISYLSRICVCAWWFATQSMELGVFGFVIGLLSCHCPDYRIGT